MTNKRGKRTQVVMRLAAWRKFRGWTIEELANRSGLSIGQISGMETGLVGFSADSIERVSTAIRCSPGDLFDTDPINPAPSARTWSRVFEEASEEERQKLLKIWSLVKR